MSEKKQENSTPQGKPTPQGRAIDFEKQNGYGSKNPTKLTTPKPAPKK